MKKNLSISIFVTAICLLVLSTACTRTPPYTQQTLPSGRTIKIGGVGKMYFTNDEPALILKYYTEINISDSPALREEVDDIWQSFRFDVEKAGLKSAIISAKELPMGLISITKECNFVFSKQGNGSWKRRE